MADEGNHENNSSHDEARLVVWMGCALGSAFGIVVGSVVGSFNGSLGIAIALGAAIGGGLGLIAVTVIRRK